MEEILILNAALALAERLMPSIERAFKAGQITAEQQQEARDRYAALRAAVANHTAFAGPEWEQG